MRKSLIITLCIFLLPVVASADCMVVSVCLDKAAQSMFDAAEMDESVRASLQPEILVDAVRREQTIYRDEALCNELRIESTKEKPVSISCDEIREVTLSLSYQSLD